MTMTNDIYFKNNTMCGFQSVPYTTIAQNRNHLLHPTYILYYFLRVRLPVSFIVHHYPNKLPSLLFYHSCIIKAGVIIIMIPASKLSLPTSLFQIKWNYISYHYHHYHLICPLLISSIHK